MAELKFELRKKVDSLLSDATASPLKWGRPDGRIVTRAELIDEARDWIGTPYHHQAELKGVGCDCGGLIRGVSVALGLIPPDYRQQLPEAVRAYPRDPVGDLGQMLCEWFWEQKGIKSAEPGDVAIYAWPGQPARHTGFLTNHRYGGLGLLHALNYGPRRMVTEHVLDKTWRQRLVAVYRLPGVQ